MAVVAAPFLLRQPLTGLLHSPSSRSLAPPSTSGHRRRSRHGHPRCRVPSCCISLDRADEAVSAAPPRSSSGLRVALAGGGTGGHVYPAIAIADEIRNADPGVRILFLGSGTGMESVAVPSAGYDFAPVPSVRLARPIFLSLANVLLPFRLLAAVIASWKKLREFDPAVVVGTGGYVSAPVCLAAVLLPRVRLVIQEQNSFPGIANRVLAPFAEKIFLAFPSSIKYFPMEKCVVSGNPVRLSLRRFVSKAVARSHFFPSAASRSAGSTAQVVLVLGGSSGAHAINITVLNMYSQMLSGHKNRFIIWQTGEDNFNEMESLVKTHRRLFLTPFLHTMDLAYAAADVVVSRAGAMTCTEILTTGKPSILIPSPNVAGDHQTKNANIMADIAGSKVLTEDELDSSTLEVAIDEILGDESLMAEMSEKAMKSAMPNASTDIARIIIALSESFSGKQENAAVDVQNDATAAKPLVHDP